MNSVPPDEPRDEARPAPGDGPVPAPREVAGDAADDTGPGVAHPAQAGERASGTGSGGRASRPRRGASGGGDAGTSGTAATSADAGEPPASGTRSGAGKGTGAAKQESARRATGAAKKPSAGKGTTKKAGAGKVAGTARSGTRATPGKAADARAKGAKASPATPARAKRQDSATAPAGGLGSGDDEPGAARPATRPSGDDEAIPEAGRDHGSDATAPGPHPSPGAAAVAAGGGPDEPSTVAPTAGRQRKPHRIFDRPRPPRDWRWVVGGIGKSLIFTGLLMFAFVAYQLWGTGIHTAQAQNRLDREFEQLAEAAPLPTLPPATTVAPTSTTPGNTTTTEPGPTTTTTEPAVPFQYPTPTIGDPVVRLEIPEIGVDYKVIEGVGVRELKDGPGHFPESALPGQLGNSAVAGHRTTYGHPFYDIDQLEPGDEIVFTYPRGERFVYAVTSVEIVSANDYAKVVPTVDPARATVALVSCHPIGTSSKRIIAHGELQEETSDAVIAPIPSTTTTTAAPRPGETIPTPEVTLPVDDPAPEAEASADAFSQGWFADSAAWPHVVLWGLLLAGLFFGAYRLAKATRRIWLGTVAGAVPVVVVMYFWFENVSRLLPPGL